MGVTIRKLYRPRICSNFYLCNIYLIETLVVTDRIAEMFSTELRQNNLRPFQHALHNHIASTPPRCRMALGFKARDRHWTFKPIPYLIRTSSKRRIAIL